ncbi:MAG: His/Gly/Thr/Pro-type tRNA ligase C-terminal domain-containing protein, partial [Halomonas sp.]
MKKADKSNATMAILLGEDEIAEQSATLKFLRDDREQQRASFAALGDTLRELLAINA